MSTHRLCGRCERVVTVLRLLEQFMMSMLAECGHHRCLVTIQLVFDIVDIRFSDCMHMGEPHYHTLDAVTSTSALAPSTLHTPTNHTCTSHNSPGLPEICRP